MIAEDNITAENFTLVNLHGDKKETDSHDADHNHDSELTKMLSSMTYLNSETDYVKKGNIPQINLLMFNYNFNSHIVPNSIHRPPIS